MKNKKSKVGLWSALTAITAILTIAAIVGNIIANQYATTINVALNASTYKIIHDSSNTEDTEYFKKGFASDAEREAYEAELCAQVEAEGAALLKNQNAALPLAQGAKVSLFGHGSVDLMYGGTGSGSVDTSKAPVRVADDVDETALSYSEIKALATGNPLIIEKCNLDMEVARLNMLKASHLNQVYALEELVYRKYPEEITRLTERIEGYEQDVALVAAHPKAQEGFCGMEVDGKHYAEKEDAGKAIIDVCTRMTGSDAVLLGHYRGFSMVLAYDGRSNEYRITLKGTLSHTVTLGADVFGNITRLDNALENLAGSLQAEQNSLEETKTQLENARTELATPFAREEELAEKTARLKELNILLNMDEKDKTLMDDGPDEGEEIPERKVVGLER